MSRCQALLASILGVFLLCLAPLAAQPQFEDLVQAVRTRNDAAAVQLSLELLERGTPSYGLYYNQGLAYRNTNQPARARAAFENALLYAPRDLSARRRLREVKERLSPQLAEHDVTGTPWWTRAEAALLLLLPALAVLSLGTGRALGRKVSNRSVTSSLVLFALLTTLVALHNPAPRRAVVVSTSAKLLTEADGTASGTALPDGVLVNVLGEDGHFREIELGDGGRGWVRSAELVELGRPARAA